MSLESKPIPAAELRSAVESSKAYARLIALFDEGSMTEFDPLSVSEGKPAEVVAAFGLVNGINTCAFAQNSAVAGGAISKASAAKIARVFDYALKVGAPIVGIYDSTGARLKQGNEMLSAIGDLLNRSNNLSGVVPQIAVVAGPCIGSASMLAASADIVICADGANYGIDTAGNNLSSKDAAENGTAHIIAKNDLAAVAEARNILALLPQNNLAAPAVLEFAEPDVNAAAAAAQKISSGKPAAEDIVAGTVDAGSFIELNKDFGKCVVTGLATINGAAVGVIITGADSQNILVCREGASKGARFVRFCDAFSIPVITYVNAGGFTSLREASMMAHAYAEATTLQVSVITGAAYGSGYIALAGSSAAADFVFAWNNAVIAPLAPETAAAVLFSEKFKGVKDQKAARAEQVAEYKATLASPLAAAEEGYIQDVIAPADTRAKLISVLSMLAGKRVARHPKKHSNIQL